MHDVALAAGVSVMTVSNVINGNHARVGRSTQTRVMNMIEELGYRVNVPARQLRKGRTGRVALAIPDLSGYYAMLADILVGRFQGEGYRLVVEYTGGLAETEQAMLASSSLDGYDGLVLGLAHSDAADIERLVATTPVVLVGERAFVHRYDHVVMDNVRGAQLATDHLIERGSRQIVVLGGVEGTEDSMPELRTRGYLQAHQAHGIPVDDARLAPLVFTIKDGYEAIHRLHLAGVELDGVLALTDSAGIGAIRALTELGLSVPRDVQVIGWDNLAMSSYSVPSLTTVEPANDEMADAVVSLLLDRVKGLDPATEGRLIMPQARLVLRESTR